MVYTPDIPQSTDSPSVSQSEILGNFQAIDTVVAVNHIGFDESGQGKHKFMQMPEQSSAPTTAANEGALYTKEGSVSGVAELFFRRESDGDEIQLTGDSDTSTNGEITIGAVTIKWGKEAPVVGAGTNSVTYGTAFATATLNVVASATSTAASSNNAQTIISTSLSTTGFDWARNSLSGSSGIFWIAIGY